MSWPVRSAKYYLRESRHEITFCCSAIVAFRSMIDRAKGPIDSDPILFPIHFLFPLKSDNVLVNLMEFRVLMDGGNNLSSSDPSVCPPIPKINRQIYINQINTKVCMHTHLMFDDCSLSNVIFRHRSNNRAVCFYVIHRLLSLLQLWPE